MLPRVRAPDLPSDLPWLNSDQPRSLKEFRGRVVLLDFWTYGCINCLHVLPELKALEEKYGDRLQIIGIHTAKFDNEQEVAHVEQAILRYGISHPVVVDRSLQIWQAYSVKAWPTLVVIDATGYVVQQVAGEGHQAALDRLIHQLVQDSPTQDLPRVDQSNGRSPSLLSPLAFPGGILADANCDRLYISDSGHHRIVVTTLAGDWVETIGTGTAGWTDGGWDHAQFQSPQGLALDGDRAYLYVADTGNHLIRRLDLRQRTVETVSGTGQQSRWLYPHGGRSRAIALNSPWDVVWLEGVLFIAMAGCHQIWQLDLAQQILETYLGTGAEASFDGDRTQAAFAQPSGLATDGKTLYVTDSESSSIRRVHLTEEPWVETVCGSGALFGFGDRDGQGLAVRLQHCIGIAIASDRLWITDTYNHKIKQIDSRMGLCQTVAGDGTAGNQNGAPLQARFFEPSGLSATPSAFYIADTNNHTIRQIDRSTGVVTSLPLRHLCPPGVCFPDSSQSS